MITFKVEGGIGDILLGLSGIKKIIDLFNDEELKCVCISHFAKAEQLFRYSGIENIEYHFFNSPEEYMKTCSPVVAQLEADQSYIGDSNSFIEYPSPHIEIPEDIRNKAFSKLFKHLKLVPDNADTDIVSIHPFGSVFSNDFIKGQRNKFGKNIPIEQLIVLIKGLHESRKDIAFNIIGSPSESKMFDVLKYNLPDVQLVPVFEEDIWVAFAFVDISNVLFGADSAMKSFSCMNDIDTVIMLEDYDDHIRDEKFIKPYVDSGILSAVKYDGEITDNHMEQAAKIIRELLP